MEISTTGSFSGGRTVWVNPSIRVANASSLQLFPNNTYSIILLPGETLTISGYDPGGGSASVDTNIIWEEQF
jgi:hypothetical protein